jgi:hypothetical protein
MKVQVAITKGGGITSITKSSGADGELPDLAIQPPLKIVALREKSTEQLG